MTRDKVFRIADLINEYCLYGVIFFIPISKAALEIFFTLAWFSFIVKLFAKHDFGFLKKLPNLFILFFITFCALSLFNSGAYFSKSFTALFFKWSKYILTFLMIQRTMNNPRRIKNCVYVFLALSFFTALDAITQWFWRWEFFQNEEYIVTEHFRAARAAFNHYNDLASYLIFPLSLSLAALISLKEKIKFRPAFFVLFILSVAAIMLTFSRGAWLGFFLSISIMLLLTRNLKIILGLAVLFIAAMAFIVPLRERFLFSFQAGGDAGRFEIWQAALAMIKNHPFLGQGVGTFMDIIGKYMPGNALYAHNSYLQIWAETGIFSIVSFFLFLSTLLFGALKSLMHDKNFMFLGLFCGLCGFLLHCFFDTQLYSLQMSYLFWTMAGLVLVLSSPYESLK